MVLIEAIITNIGNVLILGSVRPNEMRYNQMKEFYHFIEKIRRSIKLQPNDRSYIMEKPKSSRTWKEVSARVRKTNSTGSHQKNKTHQLLWPYEPIRRKVEENLKSNLGVLLKKRAAMICCSTARELQLNKEAISEECAKIEPYLTIHDVAEYYKYIAAVVLCDQINDV